MFCINCFHKKTNVANSRPHKSSPSVWRRRKCPECGSIFTTYERPSLADNKFIYLANNRTDTFNLGRLTISLSRAFTHDPVRAKNDSLWLAQTIEDILSIEYSTITPDDIAAVAHQTLKRFDELAALQYAAQHQLIATTRRRGRPSISPVWRALPTDE